MPYQLPGGVLHRTRACPCVTPKHRWVPHTAATCARCWDVDVVCVACQETAASVGFACGHAFCAVCAVQLVDGAIVPRLAALHCPCGARGALLDVHDLPVDALLGRVALLEEQPRPTTAALYAERAARLQVDACPHCGGLFVDFNGCAAVQCECGGWFCALCLRAFDDSAAAHAHVAQCTRNGDVFLPLADWRRHRDAARCVRFLVDGGVAAVWRPLTTFANGWLLMPHLHGRYRACNVLLCSLCVQTVLLLVSVCRALLLGGA